MTGKRKKIDTNIVFILIVFLCLCLCFVSCNPKSVGIDLSESFSQIYNKTDTDTYTAIDIKQTRNGGYIILGKIDKHPYLLKVDKQGDFLWDTKDEDTFKNYIYPVPNLLLNQEDQAYYFFCNKIFNDGCEDIDENIEIPTLVKFSEENKSEVEEVSKICFVNIYRDYKYTNKPTHASIIGKNNYLLLTSNNWGDVVTFIGEKNIGIGWSKDLNNNDYWNGYECFVPYPSADKRFHYTGIFKKTRKYYFQTFFESDAANFDLDCFVMRMEAPDGSEPHVEFSLERPFIAMEWDDSQWDVSNWDGTQWDGLKLSGAYIYNNIISLFVNAEIKMDEGSQLPQIVINEVHQQPELLETKPVYIKTMNVNGQKTVFFVGSTKSDNIVLFAYDLLGDPLGKKYYGDIHIYEAAGLIVTDDEEGLAILGTTYVVGRLARICLFKLSKAELEDMVIVP